MKLWEILQQYAIGTDKQKGIAYLSKDGVELWREHGVTRVTPERGLGYRAELNDDVWEPIK